MESVEMATEGISREGTSGNEAGPILATDVEETEAAVDGISKPEDLGEVKGEVKEVEYSLKTLLSNGVHFGHQTNRWNPAMAPYIYTVRNGIHIINLPRTLECAEAAFKAVRDNSATGGTILFVGTKRQAQTVISEEAQRCGAFFVSHRWLGGMLTNFSTITRSIDRMKKIEVLLSEEEERKDKGESAKFTKKERLMLSREYEKLENSLGGIKDMHTPPKMMFVVDVKREEIAVKEAKKLGIPVVALVDTNCDPNSVEFPVPSNDDGTRAIRLFTAGIANAVIEGRKSYGGAPRKAS